jgi:hypothetical protein
MSEAANTASYDRLIIFGVVIGDGFALCRPTWTIPCKPLVMRLYLSRAASTRVCPLFLRFASSVIDAAVSNREINAAHTQRSPAWSPSDEQQAIPGETGSNDPE